MIYAVGDIHGQFEQLVTAHKRIAADKAAHASERAVTVHVGDLCDRGPDTKNVIDFMIDGVERGENWIILRGNHDQLFVDFLDGQDSSKLGVRNNLNWFSANLGGKATLASYGLKKSVFQKSATFSDRARAEVPLAHQQFLRALPHWYRADDMIFVHAGIRPGIPIEQQSTLDLMWIRDDFLWQLDEHEALIVHGHTPVNEPTHYGNRVNIDTSAGWGGELIPVVFDGGACFALTEQGREEVPAPGD